MAQNGHKGTVLNFQTQVPNTGLRLVRVLICQMFYSNHKCSLFVQRRAGGGFYRSQRQVAPQGSTSPVSLTGSPSSRLSEWPPNFLVKMLSHT